MKTKLSTKSLYVLAGVVGASVLVATTAAGIVYNVKDRQNDKNTKNIYEFVYYKYDSNKNKKIVAEPYSYETKSLASETKLSELAKSHVPNNFEFESYQIDSNQDGIYLISVLVRQLQKNLNIVIVNNDDNSLLKSHVLVIPFEQDQLQIDQLQIPSGYHLKNKAINQIHLEPNQEELQVDVVPDTKEIRLRYFVHHDQNNELLPGKELVLSVPYETETLDLYSNPQYLPNNYLLANDQAQVINLQKVNDVVLVEKAVRKSATLSFYLDNSKIEEKIVSIPNEQETIDLTAFIPEGYKLAQGQENIVDYSSELRINLSKITKLVTFEFMLENNTKVGSYQANFLPETTTVNLDLRQIPHDFVLVENIQEFAINDVIRVTVRPKYKYFTLVFEVNKQKVEEKMNLKIDFLANKIDLTQYLPIGMKLANNQETMVEYQPGVVVQVVYIKKDSQVIYYDIDSQKVVSTISKKVEYNVNQIDVQSELPNGYFLAPGQKEVVDFANQIRVNITKNNPGSSENVNEEPITNHESNSEVVESENLHAFSLIKDNYSLFDMRNLNDRFHNLENKITDIDHLNNTELSSLNQELNSFLITLEEQIKSNWTNKQEEIKQLINNFASQNYYMDDFSALLETLNSSFETQNSKTNLVRFYVLNNLKFQDLKQQIIEFKNQVDSFDLSSGDVRQGGRYNIFVNLNYPRPTGAEYIIGTNSKVQVQLTFQDKNNSQAIFNLKHLKKYLSENKLKLQAKFGVRTSKFYEIALDQIDFASNSIFLNYSSTTNEEWILKFNLQNINHSTISYNTYDKKDQSFNIFVRSGNNPDQTPNRSEVTPNSLADYWLFPSTYKIQFREKLETEGANEATLRKLNSYIQENGKTSWNTKISNGQAFSYQDALWIAFLNFFKQANFANNDFTLEENQTLFTKPFDTNGSFSFQFSAIANQAKAIGSLNYFGGSFFEVAFLSSHLASYKLQSQDRLKIIFSLNNQGDSWKQGYKANALPVLINNSNGNLTPLRFLGFNGKYPFLANIYGNFTLQVFVNDSKIYELSSNQANNTHVFPIFVLNKNQTDGQGVIDVYTSGTRSAIG